MKLMLNGDVQYITVIIYCGYKLMTGLNFILCSLGCSTFLKLFSKGIIWVFDYLNPGLVDLIILGHISKFKKALGMYKLPKVNLK